MWFDFVSNITSAVKECIPTTKPGGIHKKKNWLTIGTVKEIKKKNQYCRNESNFKRYAEIRMDKRKKFYCPSLVI